MNKIGLTKNIYYKTSLLILSVSFLVLSGCRMNKTNSDVINNNSKPAINSTKEGSNNTSNLSETPKQKKIKKCFFSKLVKYFVNPYDDDFFDPEDYPESDYEYQIDYEDIRDQRD